MYWVLPKLLDLFYPKFCFGCKAEGFWLCSRCEKDLPRVFKPPPYPFSRLLIVSKYTLPLKDLIHTFKYEDGKALKEPLGALLLKRLQGFDEQGFGLMAIPLHKRRQAFRGFNQAELLVKEISRKLDLPILGGLERIRNTPPQVEIKEKRKRVENLKDSFVFKGKLTGQKIILVDDVTTTGATLAQAARALKRAGAKEVVGLVLAHG